MRYHSTPVLEVTGLGIRRGRAILLDSVSWSLARGEHWVVLGSNGSGKTSLLSALTGYLTPTCGEIHLLGSRYGEADWRELRKHVGLVSSSIRQLMPEAEPAIETIISGRHAMIDLWGRASRLERAQARVLLAQIECSHLTDRPWAFLSQGERQRVLIGRALMARPSILILDEPCSGLDPVAREHFLQFLNRMASRRNAPALVLVTHHVEEIMPVFSHAMLLKEGRVLAAGPRAAILNSRRLTETFGTPVTVRRRNNRYTLSVTPNPKSVM